jgi:hypothetical protein
VRVRDCRISSNAAPVQIAVKGGSSLPQSIENHDDENKSPKELTRIFHQVSWRGGADGHGAWRQV